jgi:hypothetical protein
MADSYESAELLTALWLLGGDPHTRMPTSHGILDRALHAVRGDLPSELGEGLTFSNTSVGLRCFELPGILLAAQEALLTSEPNPTYLSTDITLDEDAARQIVLGVNLTTREARKIGELLRTQVTRVAEEVGATLEPIAA